LNVQTKDDAILDEISGDAGAGAASKPPAAGGAGGGGAAGGSSEAERQAQVAANRARMAAMQAKK
jgi:hypothetical protein